MLRGALRLIDDRLGRRLLVWGAALAALGVLLSALPLFDLLGYDFGFALGLVTAFAAADVGHGAAAAARRTAQPVNLLRLTCRAVGGALALLVLPLLVSLLNALRVRNCNLGAGLAFYALLPVATAVYAAVGGLVAGLALPRRGRVVALLLPALSLGWSLLRLYRDPAVFALDPFGGYFPGPIYDEALRPPARLVWYRVTNLVWAAGALAVVAALSGGCATSDGPPRPTLRPARPPLPVAAAAAVLVLLGVTLFQLRGRLGFHVRHQDLERALPQTRSSPRFVLHAAAGESADALAQAAADVEFRYQQLVRTLGTPPRGPITVWRFPDANVKKDLVGAGHTLFAKPWTGEIFVHGNEFPSTRLRHEMAHVFGAAFGDPLFGVALKWRLPFPRLASGLIEGLAEAADYGDPSGRTTIHQDARAMMAAGHAPPLAKVVGAGFTAVSGPRAYTMAGSFTHFLLRERGAERLRALYRSGGDFVGVYGEALGALERRWRAFLETQPLPAAEKARAAERFRRPAIFGKVCARELAARVAEARSRLGSAEAVGLLESVCRDDPGEPSYRLELADALVAAGRVDEALALASAAERDETRFTVPLRARAANLAATLHFHAGRFTEAAAAVERARRLATDEGEERTAAAKLRALADERARRTLGRVLFGDGPGKGTDPGLVVFLISEFARAFPDEALGPYLLGRQLAWRDPRIGAATLEQACPGGQPGAHQTPLAPAFHRECRRLLADTTFRAGDLPRAEQLHRLLRDEAATEADRLRAGDMLERIAWQRSAAAR